MAYYKATIEVLLDVDDVNEACDAMAECIRPLLKEFGAENSHWIDWRYHPSHSVPVPDSGEGFEYETQ